MIVTCSQVGVKEERDDDSTAGHLHRFQVKSSSTEPNEYTIDFDQPCTVLEAIKSDENFKKKMKSSDKNIMIQLGKEDKNYIFATHFLCFCIRRGESLILSYKSEQVEAVQDQQDNTIQPRHKYSVFYIETEVGLYTKTKKPFRNNAVTQFKYLCDYGETGMTVEEALKRDGRFIDDLSNIIENFTKIYEELHQQFPRLKELMESRVLANYYHRAPYLELMESRLFANYYHKAPDLELMENRVLANYYHRAPGLQLMENRVFANYYHRAPDLELMENRVLANYYHRAPGLQLMESRLFANYYHKAPYLELMESRLFANYYHKALDLKKENFGNIQRLFSKAHREMILELGESVCKVVVQNGATGTGFVLFDNFILTNAHILKDCFEGEKLKPGINVDVLFNYDDPESHINYYCFQAHCVIWYSDGELDYAILELNLESRKQSKQTNKMKVGLPPGLLKRFGEAPTTGEACLIGHPAGQVKKIDHTCIIEKENREQTVIDHFRPYKDKCFVDHTINELKEQDIKSIMMGGYKADKVTTYNTFMYHGASGSPVFDAHGNVFGLHTGGFVYGFPSDTKSVIEYAQPVLPIVEHFVSVMKKSENVQSLLRVREKAQGNSKLYEVFESVLKGSIYEALLWSVDVVKAEPADSDEPMDTN